MNFHIITIFPHIFDSYLNESILRRAQDGGQVKIITHDLRKWTSDKHKTVDDTPYGGGAGMVMKVDVLYRALQDIKSGLDSQNSKVILLSAKGKTWKQQKAHDYTKLDDVILICGRYEGVDERILNFVDEEISIGDYVLTGGEIPALAIVDSITRLIPGVVGNEASPVDESHSELGILEYPQYTRPEVFIDKNGIEHKVPEILLSGNHAEIDKFRKSKKKVKNS
jgi:tRNA (guanine37-N1)-methyltransferase